MFTVTTSIQDLSEYKKKLSAEVDEAEAALKRAVDGELPLQDLTTLARRILTAGLALVVANHAKLAARLFMRYRDVLSRWKT